MLLNKIHEVGKECSGCSLCASICPNGAIVMRPNNEGFFMPSIDADKCISCGLCERKCTQLNLIKSNYADPACYAVKANDEILRLSSSGGVFSVLAEFVFEKGGYVCGAAYDENFTGVSHIMISDRFDMYKLRGSKYVYSKINGIYEQVKEKLEGGSYVLFSGTPCQVAALNAYLPFSYENLITVDLLCAGVPSEKIFRKYISEVAQDKKIVSVSFRPKEYGWDLDGIQINFDDSSEYMVHSIRDPYFKGFLNYLFKSNACVNCSYATFPRQADFSMGDFWQIDKYDDSIETDNGISCILLNNQNAENIFEKVFNDFSFMKKMPLSFLVSHNALCEKRRPHLARSRFYSLIDRGYGFKKAVSDSLPWRFDIALTGCWTVPNYGGELTYYALYKTLLSMGYTVIMVERRADMPDYNVPVPTLFKNNPYPFYDVSRIHKSFVDQLELNERVKTFIVGSDQIWNYNLFTEESINSYSLDYVQPYRKKIAYSTSFGSVQFIGTEAQNDALKKHLQTFNFVSVREKRGVDICREMGIEAKWVIDPILLADKEVFRELSRNSAFEKNDAYLFYYFIDPIGGTEGLEKLCDACGVGYHGTITADFELLNNLNFSKERYHYVIEDNLCLEDWLNYIINSKYIVTDSFHGVCLAIKFQIPFIYIKGDRDESNGLDRITTVLEEFGLMFAMVDNIDVAVQNNTLFGNYNWNKVEDKLSREKIRCKDLLKKAVDSELI